MMRNDTVLNDKIHTEIDQQLMAPSFRADTAIGEKYNQLGGLSSPLGQPTADVQVCPDGNGYFRHFQDGAIYWTSHTGAHEVHGDIGRHWGSLGWERGLLGYPTTDETSTPDGIGRYNHFQHGSIYWTPQTGACEVHGAIREKWQSLGWERSFLGYPVTDENDFPEEGRVSAFEHGAIYCWADTGPIELNDVVVHYTGLICFGETDNDQLSNSDEPYVIMGVVAPTGGWSVRSQIYEDVDGRESRPDLLEVYRGKPGGLALSVLLMEHDEGDPDKYKAAMTTAVGAAFTGVTALITIIPVVGAVLGTVAGALLGSITPTVANELNKLLDLGDDRLGDATLAITAKQMVVLAARTGNTVERGVGFKLETPMLRAYGASYKVYFGLVPA